MTDQQTHARLTPDRLERLRALAAALRDKLELTGPWRWAGDAKWDPMLTTVRHGRRVVMSFDRLGMRGAQPMFPVKDEGERWSILQRGRDIAVYEVCPEATSADDPRVYRHQIAGFRSEVADYLAEVDADTVIALIDQVTAQRAALAEIGELVVEAEGPDCEVAFPEVDPVDIRRVLDRYDITIDDERPRPVETLVPAGDVL